LKLHSGDSRHINTTYQGEGVPGRPGIYTLILKILEGIEVNVGRLGTLRFGKGIYMYVGSARGPGGLKARLTRHCRGPTRTRWHIDYLTSNSNVRVTAAVIAEANLDLEEVIAGGMLRKEYCIKPAIKGFGSTDKTSYTHLFTCTCSMQRCITTAMEVFKESSLKPMLVECKIFH